jgi:hypothetical protein
MSVSSSESFTDIEIPTGFFNVDNPGDVENPGGATSDGTKDQRISELENKINLMMTLMSTKTKKEPKADDKQTEEPDSMADIIGFDDFRKDNRNDAQIELAGASSISAKDRATLSVSEKGKLFKDATRGISPDKFKPLIDLSGLDSLLTMENIVGFNTLNDDLQKFLLQYGLTNVFYILKFDAAGELLNPSTPDGIAVNYLANPQGTTAAEVLKTSDYLLKKGSLYHVENLRWTYEAIMNSCDQDMRIILKSKMEKYEKTRRTGPVLYTHLLEQLTSSSPGAVRKVTQNIVDLKMDKFVGESIPMACKSIRASFKWLEMVRKMPADPDTIVMNIFETCTVPEYLRYLESLKTYAELHASGTNLSVDYILTKSEDKYRDLVLNSKWDISGTGATFYQSPSHRRNQSGNDDKPTPYDRPSEGESEVKNILGQEHKYCGRCNRWNKGSRAHTTSEHIVGRRRDTNKSTGDDSSKSDGEKSVNTSDSKTRHPNAQSYHFKRVNFVGGI